MLINWLASLFGSLVPLRHAPETKGYKKFDKYIPRAARTAGPEYVVGMAAGSSRCWISIALEGLTHQSRLLEVSELFYQWILCGPVTVLFFRII